jgi:rhomboid protease GluP
MATCVQCGRELPSFSTGDLKNVCPACQFQIQQQQAAQPQPAQRKATLMEQVQSFPVTSTIVAINTAIYIACVIGSYTSHQGNAMDFTTDFVLRWGADYGPLTLNGQWWRVFTSMWLHGNILHIVSNMYCFWQFGRVAERIFGRSRYLAIYLIAGIGSSLGSLAWHPATVSVGASGAIFGVAGALFVPFFHKRLRLPQPVMSSMLRSIGLFIVINLIIGASISFIDNSAHVGGLITGLILGEVFVHVAGSDESSVWKVTAASAILLVAAFIEIRQWRLPDTLAAVSLNALENGNQSEALAKAQQAVALRPKDELSHVALGEVYLQQKKFPEAVTEYQTAHQLAPDDSSIDARLGHAYARVSDWKNAEPLLRTALKDEPKDSDAMIDLAVTLAATNRDQEGLDWAHKALAIDPSSARGQFVLGSILASEGKYRDALPPLREAVRLDPSSDDYKKALTAAQQANGSVGN